MSQAYSNLENIVALAKRRGFIYPSAEIYGGINGIYDTGNLGVLLKENIKKLWLSSLSNTHGDILRFDGAQLGPEAVWRASGHIENFSDPMVDCLECKKRFRADEINLEKACTNCGKKNWTEPRAFNLMFKTQLGAMSGSASDAYLRPETAQSIFINFKNIISTNRTKIPFGVAQIGKAFRNEITPKQFLFRMREFEQMELEWFCTDKGSDDFFTYWLNKRLVFYHTYGINPEHIRLRPHEQTELSHYSRQTTDVEYLFPFGWKEMEGIAHRGTFDLTQHSTHSGKEMSVYDEEAKASYIPTVIECSVGLDRLFLMFLCNAYQEDTLEDETRVVLKLHPKVAPITAAILPLTNKLRSPVEKLYEILQAQGYSVTYDVSGSIGKRYRRQDEIGTPYCFTYDFDSETDQQITVRDRDTAKQERISIDRITQYLDSKLKI